jgi:hypothetical protein
VDYTDKVDVLGARLQISFHNQSAARFAAVVSLQNRHRQGSWALLQIMLSYRNIHQHIYIYDIYTPLYMFLILSVAVENFDLALRADLEYHLCVCMYS